MNLYLNSATDYSIVDDGGHKYTLDEAKQIVADNKLSDCNVAFSRLVNFDFDVEKVRSHYATQATGPGE